MTEDTLNTTPQPETEKLSEEAIRNAVNIVLTKVNNRRVELEECAAGDDGGMMAGVRGLTTEGYDATVGFDTDAMAEIMLEYRYYVFEVLGLDAPSGMFTRLAMRTGLSTVEEVWLE